MFPAKNWLDETCGYCFRVAATCMFACGNSGDCQDEFVSKAYPVSATVALEVHNARKAARETGVPLPCRGCKKENCLYCS